MSEERTSLLVQIPIEGTFPSGVKVPSTCNKGSHCFRTTETTDALHGKWVTLLWKIFCRITCSVLSLGFICGQKPQNGESKGEYDF